MSSANSGVSWRANRLSPEKIQSPVDKSGAQHHGPARPRRPIVGEALIDTDGVVWLIESVQPVHDADFIAHVARITNTTATPNEPTSHHLSRSKFEAFCRIKGIVLRGG